MAQSSYTIANQAGAAFRAAINTLMGAIRTQNSGATAPSETAPYMLWADSATGLLKQRNAADSAWLILGHLASLMPRRGHIDGLTLSNNATDATNDIDIAAGECADSTNATLIRSTASMTKRLDAAWAAGTGNGGLDTGSIANTTYHVFAIQKDSDGSTDFLFSASATAPTMPSGYTYFRRIGSILRESAAIVAFSQLGDEFLRAVPATLTATNPGASGVTRTLSVPIGIQVQAIIGGYFNWATSGGSWHRITSMDETDAAAANTNATHLTITGSATVANIGRILLRTNASGQVRTRHSSSGASDEVRINTLGWIDTRGRT